MNRPHDPTEILHRRMAEAVPSDFLSGKAVEAALSGGLDSVVLLHLLAEARNRQEFELKAVHVHHGLSPDADDWADFCTAYCTMLGVPLRIVRVKVDAAGLGIEAAARAVRYRAFSDGLCDIVALAHHHDDQIETFMLSALRGGGLRGMAAMPELRPLNEKTKIWRPLLSSRREELAQYAAVHGLDYVDDASNLDNNLLRNWLRNDILPQFQVRVPEFKHQITANIAALQDDLSLLDEITEEDIALVCANGWFDVDVWRGLSDARRRRVLHRFVQEHGLGVPTRAGIGDFAQTLLAFQTASAEWTLPKGKIHVYRNRLFAVRNDGKNFPWLREGGLKGRLKNVLNDNGFVLAQRNKGLGEEALNAEATVRPMRSGDIIRLQGGSKKVRKLLQEKGVPPFMRTFWPVVADVSDNCIAVVNICVSSDYEEADGMQINFFASDGPFVELNRK
ncbi:tRNA lysidine(34) synthetase TilS [Neisseria sp.]|uniref:tRNA lysidine(34) synthetase TilS n=1 Tax=Neisseria sp. TaxID=192066 RepID=UPI0035A07526